MKEETAIYARVSSKKQEEMGTIDSQLHELRERAEADGHSVREEMEFVDEGVSGATLRRAGLERLRDQIGYGLVKKLYVLSPDRLARKQAYQTLLLDEFEGAGVEVVFLNWEGGDSPEEQLMMQMQGMISEYERAKIKERMRRGKRQAAREGDVSVFGSAPYGYNYISKKEGEQARFEINLSQAKVVRKIFEYVGKKGMSTNEVAQKLTESPHETATGNNSWSKQSVAKILKNPAYKGKAAYGKKRSKPRKKMPLRDTKSTRYPPKTDRVLEKVEKEKWIEVPVPAIVEEELFEAVQKQLEENRRSPKAGKKESKTLLQGLTVCKQCGYAYCGYQKRKKLKSGEERTYGRYRCTGRYAAPTDREIECDASSIKIEKLDQMVWDQVKKLLKKPERLREEFKRRRSRPKKQEKKLNQTQKQIDRLNRKNKRLLDLYEEGIIEKKVFKRRQESNSEKIDRLETQQERINEQLTRADDLQLIVTKFDKFVEKMQEGFEDIDWHQKQEIIRAVVRRIEIGDQEVNVVFRVQPLPTETRIKNILKDRPSRSCGVGELVL